MTTSVKGYWCDVCSTPMGIAFCYVTGSDPDPNKWVTVVCVINNQEQWRTNATSTPRYLRCASDSNNNVTCVGQGQNGEGLLVIRQSGCYNWYPQSFSGPALYWDNERFHVYVQVSNSQYRIISEGIGTSQLYDIPIWPGGNGTTPNGWSSVEDGEQIWADEVYSETIRGYNFLITTQIDNILIGQYGGIAGGINVNEGGPFIAINAQAMQPRLAYWNGLYAACSWTTNNIAYYNEFPPYVPVPEEPIEIIGRPIHFGFFDFPGTDTNAPRNCGITTNEPKLYLRDLNGNIICRYIAATDDSNLDELNRLTDQAKKEEPNIEVGGYWTYNAQKIGIPTAKIKFLEAYMKTWESLRDLEDRIRKHSMRGVILVGQCYTSNKSNTEDIKQLIALYSRVLKDYNGGLILFNNGHRSGNDVYGWLDHHEVHNGYKILFQGITK